MSKRAVVAISVVAAVLGGLFGSLLLVVAGTEEIESLAFTVGIASFTFVGALIIWKQPNNLVGRLFAFIGLVWVFGDFAARYAEYGFSNPGSVPAPSVGAWIGEWYWIAGLLSIFGLVPLLFPTGKPLTPRWAIAARVVVGFVLIACTLAMFEDRLDVVGPAPDAHSAIGIPGFHDVEDGFTAPLLFGGAVGSMLVGAIGMIIRFRRSRGVERQQLKWVTMAVLAVAALFVVGGFGESVGGYRIWFVDAGSMALVPGAAALAIFRYHLYDIDVFINRALVYALLTGLLAAFYFGIVALVGSVVGENNLTVAAATLAVAALFQPLRSRIQRFIDRRFYRRKYDAEQTVDEFARRLRDEVDMDSLERELVSVVHETMQPSFVSVWVRSPG